MFARVLYVDSEVALELDWFGLGPLRARHKVGGVRRAHPVQRQAFQLVCEYFQKAGEPLSPSNPKCSDMMKNFADLLLHAPPTGLAWQIVYSDPEGEGRRYAS